MHWSDGNYWKTLIPVSELSNEFEYKYAIKDHNEINILKWENGKNRVFRISEIEEYLSMPENAYSIQISERYKFVIRDIEFVYIKAKMHLIIIDKWRA